MMQYSVACLLVLACSASAEAGPFRRHRSGGTASQCGPGGCSVSSGGGNTSSAQGVAEIQASRGSTGHHGGNSTYEGVGMGMTPQAALANCCNNGRPVIDQGVAQGRDGRWYACKRYAR